LPLFTTPYLAWAIKLIWTRFRQCH